MRNARPILALAGAAAIVGGCQGKTQPAENNTMSMDVGVPDNQVAADNAQIETLPADESSVTPSNQLANGFDNPDVNAGTTNTR